MEEFQIVGLSRIAESSTNPRRSFTGMAELTASVQAHGVLVPILVRPVNGHVDAQSRNALAIRGTDTPDFEIVAGARRFRAAEAAGLADIPVRIREMTDDEALELQVVENLQREDVHPMEEALGYQKLVERPGYDVAAIAAKVGRSESYVYQRMKLLDLIKPVEEAFLENSITAGHAVLIARLSPKDQAEALDNCRDQHRRDTDGRPMLCGVRELAAFISSNIHLDLHSAAFKKDDPDLLPAAGACTSCVKRTGFVPHLWPDIAHKDTCTDRHCYQDKLRAHISAKKAKLEKAGPVFQISTHYQRTPGEGKEILPQGEYREVDAGDKCEHARKALVVSGYHDVGKVKTVCSDPQCKIHRQYGRAARDPKEAAKEKKAKEAARREETRRERILLGIIALPPARFSREDKELVTSAFIREMQSDDCKDILKRHGWEPKKASYGGADQREGVRSQIQGLSDSGLQSLLIELSLQNEMKVWVYGNQTKTKLLENTAERYGVDVAAIERQLQIETEDTPARREKRTKADKTRSKPGKADQKQPKSEIPVEIACEECGVLYVDENQAGINWDKKMLEAGRHGCTSCTFLKLQEDRKKKRGKKRV
jgi:ParB family chromosome partitioning protein